MNFGCKTQASRSVMLDSSSSSQYDPKDHDLYPKVFTYTKLKDVNCYRMCADEKNIYVATADGVYISSDGYNFTKDVSGYFYTVANVNGSILAPSVSNSQDMYIYDGDKFIIHPYNNNTTRYNYTVNYIKNTYTDKIYLGSNTGAGFKIFDKTLSSYIHLDTTSYYYDFGFQSNSNIVVGVGAGHITQFNIDTSTFTKVLYPSKNFFSIKSYQPGFYLVSAVDGVYLYDVVNSTLTQRLSANSCYSVFKSPTDSFYYVGSQSIVLEYLNGSVTTSPINPINPPTGILFRSFLYVPMYKKLLVSSSSGVYYYGIK